MTIREELDSLGFDWSSGRIIQQRIIPRRGYEKVIVEKSDPELDRPISELSPIIARDSEFIYVTGGGDCSSWISKVALDIDYYLNEEVPSL